MKKTNLFYPLVILFGLTCALYAPSLSGDFLLDDNGYIADNPITARPGLWYKYLYDPYSHLNNQLGGQVYRPVTALSFGLNHLFGGENPFWYHLVNVLLHAANVCLVFFLAGKLLQNPVAAVGAALLFSMHPAQAESVAYIGSRATLLSLFFSMISFLLYASGDGKRGQGAGSLETAGSLAAFAAALLSKETSVFLIPVIMAHDYAFEPFEGAPHRRWKRWAPYFAVVAPYLVARRLVLGRIAQRELWGNGWISHWELSAHGWLQNAINALWPAHLRECYSFVPGPWFGPASVLISLGLLAFVSGALLAVRRRRFHGFALVWIFAGIAPVLNLIPVDALAADRFLYVPMVGIGLLLGQCLRRLKMEKAILAIGVLSLLLSLLTLDRESAWQNQFMMNLESYAAAPRDPCTCLRLGMDYCRWGMLGRGEALIQESLSRQPSVLRQSGLMGMAMVEMRKRNFRKADALLREAWILNPRRSGLHNIMGQCWLALGDQRRAQEALRIEQLLNEAGVGN